MSGTLFVVGTPLGNLEDMSPRAVRVLQEARLVAAEDTRTAQKLFARFGIATPVTSYFEGNEAQRAGELVARLEGGDDVALISEAGMPGISDPGERLVAQAVAAGLRVEVVPGPAAALTALVGSGLPTARFTFIGFAPRERGRRDELFSRFRLVEETLVLYEAPGRVHATLVDLAAVLGGGRRACVARELTKIHEEFVRGTLDELAVRFAEDAPRGEVTMVVAGASPEERAAESGPLDLDAEVSARLAAGESPKEIAAALALKTGKPKRQIYQLALLRQRPVDEE